MTATEIRFTSFPQTEPPPHFVADVISGFRSNEGAIGTKGLTKGLTSNDVLTVLRPTLQTLGFQIEASKSKEDKIDRPVFFGENGVPELRYQIDAYHPEWKCGLEVEAGRAWMGNAVYRDLIQALVMVQLSHLILAVPNAYKYKSLGRSIISSDYANTVAVGKALYGHTRVTMPYSLTIVGY